MEPTFAFTGRQRLVVALLAFVQFVVILDFMILSPLGPLVMPRLGIGTPSFGFLVSAYAFSAGVSGLLTAGFADRFDRKRLLLFFFAGFLVGTLLCGIATSYPFLLAARVVTGLFGGVIASIGQAIVADLFPLSVRGRVMGSIQSAFAASQVMGIPVGLFLAARFGWNGPFVSIAILGVGAWIAIAAGLPRVDAHVGNSRPGNPFLHLLRTASRPRYLTGFAATMLVATGGFMLQPFASNFGVHNLMIPFDRLPALYMAAGLVGMVTGPLLGRLADRIGKFRLLAAATFCGMAMVWWWTGLGASPFWLAMLGNCALMATISARQVATMALISGVPDPQERGAYMAVSSSLTQFSGAVAASAAGWLVVLEPTGRIANYHMLGWVVIGAMALTLLQMANVDRMVRATVD